MPLSAEPSWKANSNFVHPVRQVNNSCFPSFENGTFFVKTYLLKNKRWCILFRLENFIRNQKEFRSFVKGFFMLKRFVVQGGSSRVTDAGGTE